MTWSRQKRSTVALVAVGVVLAAGGIGWYFFAPKPTQMRAEAAPEGVTVLQGVFRDGAPLHHVGGTVQLIDIGDSKVLHFEDFEATAGPAVYIFLTPDAEPATAAEIEDTGTKILTPTMMGQATLRGDFNLDLPAGLRVEEVRGIAIWCERYNVLFGSATLGAP